MTSENKLVWGAHAIQLMGPDTGPRFQLLIGAAQVVDRLTEANVDVFCEELPSTQPIELQITANRHDFQALDDNVWERACRAIGKCNELRAFAFHTFVCRRGCTETKIRRLLHHTPDLIELSIEDGLYCYAETFGAIGQLESLEELELKNKGHGIVLDMLCCQALAKSIYSLPNLRRFKLSSCIFENKEAWGVIFSALREKLTLEGVEFWKLYIEDDRGTDFAPDVALHPCFLEKHAVTEYLRNVYSEPPYTMSQRLEAVIYVRAHDNLDQIRDMSPACPHALAALSDDTRFCFQFLRHESDPTVWAVNAAQSTKPTAKKVAAQRARAA